MIKKQFQAMVRKVTEQYRTLNWAPTYSDARSYGLRVKMEGYANSQKAVKAIKSLFSTHEPIRTISGKVYDVQVYTYGAHTLVIEYHSSFSTKFNR